ncbi:MAG: acyl-CoA synthetase FdrA [Paraburkholderia sp.]|jgi:FdrA protein|nr:acyl-CoA synthetase FdrA [Paraburkholderia sp.]
MLHTIIRPNTYQDSVSLMLLSKQLSGLDEVERVSIMMGTPANKDIFRDTGFGTPELDRAGAGDMVIVVDADSAGAATLVDEKITDFLTNQKAASSGNRFTTVRSLGRAAEVLPQANLALFSIPGELAAPEIERVLDAGMNAFVFSDNISIEDEVRLKSKARDLGLLMMGPDCGTGSFAGLPLAFTNIVRRGSIGIVGASGTGTQEIMVQIDRAGNGVSQAIGLGGRDLSEKVGAITCLQALAALDADPDTRVITLVSKPPAPSVREKVLGRCQQLSKPVVAILLGERAPKAVSGNIHFADTLEDAARIAVSLAGPADVVLPTLKASQSKITGLFCGGTLANETALMVAAELGVPTDAAHVDGYMLHHDGHTIIDLGDDKYTQGRPHPMIDPSLRAQMIEQAFDNEALAVLLFDVVTGYGSNLDPAGAIAPAIERGLAKARAAGREVAVVASVCGTENDPQPRSGQEATLRNAGVIVLDSNAASARFAIAIAKTAGRAGSNTSIPEPTRRLISEAPQIVNIGLPSFAEALNAEGASVVQYTWSPLAGGNTRLQKILAVLG